MESLARSPSTNKLSGGLRYMDVFDILNLAIVERLHSEGEPTLYVAG